MEAINEATNNADIVPLLDVMHHALLEIRSLCRKGSATQAADLADAVHNLPAVMLHSDFDQARLRTELAAYQEKYIKSETAPLFDYCAFLN